MIEGSPPRYRVTTLGCRVNQYESESIAAALRLNGWSHAEKPHHPDLFIINTCTVTAKAAMQSRQAVRHAIREFPRAAILVTGCYAQSEPGCLPKLQASILSLGMRISTVFPKSSHGGLLNAQPDRRLSVIRLTNFASSSRPLCRRPIAGPAPI